MNYIKQLNAVFPMFYDDDRLNNSHIGLYMALFFYWNLHRFETMFFANRTELMAMAKIGSRSTYHRLIKDLHDRSYITYFPSRNPNQKTMVMMTDYCTTCSTVSGRTSTLMERYRPKIVPASLYNKHKQTYKAALGSSKPMENLVLDFFKKTGWPDIEAQKFFNHYESIGWKIGGRIPIVDWKASARNWMLKAMALEKSKKAKGTFHFGDNLKTINDKNYDEPL
ncbi:hypothetical protein MAR621_03027 [Maribacter dokdonensis]|uniref:hypothetical protein n=1 Tax=Maribacter dokdonensis TaxID=320912 RepID=UPI001B1933FE|nr:hypothetical protein [Maribacter dokdonensis]CAG2532833.1 hypothetical protein MAR621_03027 [Maribacter dokdonensis]